MARTYGPRKRTLQEVGEDALYAQAQVLRDVCAHCLELLAENEKLKIAVDNALIAYDLKHAQPLSHVRCAIEIQDLKNKIRLLERKLWELDDDPI